MLASVFSCLGNLKQCIEIVVYIMISMGQYQRIFFLYPVFEIVLFFNLVHTIEIETIEWEILLSSGLLFMSGNQCYFQTQYRCYSISSHPIHFLVSGNLALAWFLSPI